VAVDRKCRVQVQPDCTLPGHPDIFAIGDAASLDDLPGLSEPAMQEGRYVAAVIHHRVAGDRAPGRFRYRDLGTMATVGPRALIAADDDVAIADTITGTHRGPLMGYAPTGKTIQVRGVRIGRFANGRLAVVGQQRPARDAPPAWTRSGGARYARRSSLGPLPPTPPAQSASARSPALSFRLLNEGAGGSSTAQVGRWPPVAFCSRNR
jgi:hypothetical protein